MYVNESSPGLMFPQLRVPTGLSISQACTRVGTATTTYLAKRARTGSEMAFYILIESVLLPPFCSVDVRYGSVTCEGKRRQNGLGG